MCTVTIIPRLDPQSARAGFRLGCNRDELRTRPPATHPRTHRIGQRDVLMPVDPQSCGTWIAVNDAGLVATLLNVNARDYRDADHDAPRSRGLVVPALMHAADSGAALDALKQLRPADYSPFRLVIADNEHTAEVVGDGESFDVRRHALSDAPLMWTSSGLGDHLVEQPRRELFEKWFGDDPSKWAELQDAFHRHFWPDRPHLSVCMNRPDARTVSYSVVETDADRVRLRYYDEPPDAFGPAEVAALVRQGASAA